MRIKHSGAVAGFLLILVHLIGLFVLWNKVPFYVPWLYSLAWGEGQLISKYWFAGGLAILAVMFFVDVLLAIWLMKKDKVLMDVVIWFGVAMIVLYLASLWRVLLVVI